VSRIPLNDAFHRVVEKAGLKPDRAVDVLYDEASRSDGKLDLCCDDKLLERSYIRQFLRFELGDNGIVVIGQIGAGWGRADNIFKFELDADQVEVLIARFTRKRRPKHKRAVINAARPLIEAGADNIVAKLADIWDGVSGKAKTKKERGYRKRTIRRWVAAMREGRTP
jgi:hypothetical protein